MTAWQIFAVCCVGSWGVWGFIAKLATGRGVHPLTLSVISSLTGAFATGAVFFLMRPPWERGGSNLLFALLAGVCGSAGGIAFYLALHHGRASVVVPLSSLYPAVTILLSLVFLDERPSPTQSIGIVLALIASLLLGM
jgi:transporter family protein